jgi:hypothetical protein
VVVVVVVVVGSEVCSRLKFLRVVSLVQRLFAQMVMWRKTGDHFAVGKKARPMGAGQAHVWRKSWRSRAVGKKARPMGMRLAHEKARPTPCSTPCLLRCWPGVFLVGAGFPLLNPLLAAVAGLGSSWWVHSEVCARDSSFSGKWWGSEVLSRLEFFALMVMWRKAGDPFQSAKKSATNGCEAVKKVAKSKANPLLAAVAWSSWWVRLAGERWWAARCKKANGAKLQKKKQKNKQPKKGDQWVRGCRKQGQPLARCCWPGVFFGGGGAVRCASDSSFLR